jgi:hypothetical protein
VDKLLLISLGTGYCPLSIAGGKASDYNILDWAKYTVSDRRTTRIFSKPIDVADR